MEINFTTEEWQIILLGLQELPAKQSYGLIEKIIKAHESQSSLSQASSYDEGAEGVY
jgi:hypothetical protein